MLHSLVLDCVHKYEQHTSVIFDPGVGDSDTVCKVSYSQLWQQVSELACVFSSVGVGKQVVGVLLTDCAEIPSIYLGLLSASCTFIPFNLECVPYAVSALTQVTASWIIGHSQFGQELLPLLKKLEGCEVHSEELTKYKLQLYKLWHKSAPSASSNKHQGLAYCITTSGTTSKPKIVRVPHSCIVPNILHLKKIFQLGPGDRVLLTSPLTFDPSIIDIFCTLSSGACLVIVPSDLKCKPEKFLTLLHQRQAVSVFQATPSLMRMFAPSSLQQTILGPQTTLRILALGGEKFPMASVQSWLHRDNQLTQFYNLYGITEVSCWATCHPVDVRALLNKQADADLVPIGTALDKTEVKLVTIENDEEYPGEGTIWIGSTERVCIIDDEILMAANRNQDSESNKEGNQDDIVWRNTGDLGKMLPDGNIICLRRVDDQVKRHGKRLNLGAIEKVCKELLEVADCCALLDQTAVMAFVVLNPTSPPGTGSVLEHTGNSKNSVVNNLLSPCRRGLGEVDSVLTDREKINNLKLKLKLQVEGALPKHYVPDHFMIMNGTFPLTAHGKLDKKVLLKMGREELKENLDIPITDIKRFAEELWQRHLPESPVAISSTDNFISLGGASLSAVQLVNELENTCRDNLPQFFDILLNKSFESFLEELRKYLHSRTLEQYHVSVTSLVHQNLSSHEESKELSASFNLTDSNKINTEVLDSAQCAGITVSSAVKHKNPDNSYLSLKSRKLDLETKQVASEELSSDPLKSSPLTWESFESLSRNNSDCSVDGQALPKLKLSKPKQIVSRGKLRGKSESEVESSEYSSSIVEKECCRLASNSLANKGSASEMESSSALNVISPHVVNTGLSLHLKWKFDTQKCVDASPLIVKYDSVTCAFIGSHSGQFNAIDVQSGSSLWSVTLPDRIESSACCSLCGQYIAVGCYDGCLYVLNSNTGSVYWKFTTRDMIKCSPVVDESSGNVIFGSHDGCLYSMNLQIKQCAWQSFLGGGSVFSSPVVDMSEHLVYAATLAGKMACLSTVSGTEEWSVNLGKPVFSSLCLLDNCVLAGCVDGNLYCLNSSGTMKWTCPVQAPIFSSPTVYSSTIFVGSHDQHMYSIARGGQFVWKFQAKSTVYATAFVTKLSKHQCFNNVGPSITANGELSHVKTEGVMNRNCSQTVSSMSKQCSKLQLTVVITASIDGNLYILDHENQQLLAQVKLPGEVFSSPVVVDNCIVVGCRDNFVYCYEVT